MRMHPRQEMTFHGTEGLVRLTAPFNARLFGEARVELHRNSGRPSASVTTERFTKENHYEFQVESFGRSGSGTGSGSPGRSRTRGGRRAMLDMAFAAAG
jgi:predicted dehydrogenase